jgi:nucleoside-diphosphate-sugar epimerase
MTEPRVLVTGATGFIGRQVLAPLRERGFEVHAVSSRGEPGERPGGGGEVGAVGREGEVAWYHADLPQFESSAASGRGPSREVPWYHADLPRSTSTEAAAGGPSGDVAAEAAAGGSSGDVSTDPPAGGPSGDVSTDPPAGGPSGEVAWHQADLLEPAAAQALVEAVAPTHLLHLAWYAEPGKYWRSPENLRWVEASLALLRAFAQSGTAPRRVVIAGTSAEYAWSQRTHCVEGETPLEPATLYGASKRALHLVAERFATEAGLSLAWGRIFFLYGPGESPSRLAGSVARALVRGEPAETSHGDQVRDFLHTADLGDAFAALIASDVEGPVNMASGEPVRVRDLVVALARAADRPDLLRLGARPARPDEPAELTADARRLRDEVGWTPAGSLADRAAETVAWWREREGV